MLRVAARLRSCSTRSSPRSYNYVVDHSGAVHLDSARERTLATAYRDKKFLDELYRGLRRRRGGKWASQCLGEYSLLRADTGDPNADREIIVVFDKLDDDDGLGYAGTLREAFDPSRLRWCASGRLYHELTTASRFGELGLVGSHVAHGLSERLDVRDDDVRLDWRGASYAVAPVVFPTEA